MELNPRIASTATPGLTTTRRALAMKALLALPFVRMAMAQQASGRTVSDDVSLNDRRYQILMKLAADPEFAHYIDDFNHATPEGKIEVFIQAYLLAIYKLTEAAKQRKTTRAMSGSLGTVMKILGIPVVGGAVDRATAVAAAATAAAEERKREAGVADIGLENGKAVVTRFLGEAEGTAFATARPAEKTVLLLQALKVVQAAQEQPSSYVIFGNDFGEPGHRGGQGQQAIGTMFGVDDPRYTRWDQMTRAERDLAVVASIDRYLDRAIEAAQDPTGAKMDTLLKDLGMKRPTGAEIAAEALRRAGARAPKVTADPRATARKEDLTLARAFGSEFANDPEAARCAFIMQTAWNYGYYLLLGVDESKLKIPPQ